MKLEEKRVLHFGSVVLHIRDQKSPKLHRRRGRCAQNAQQNGALCSRVFNDVVDLRQLHRLHGGFRSPCVRAYICARIYARADGVQSVQSVHSRSKGSELYALLCAQGSVCLCILRTASRGSVQFRGFLLSDLHGGVCLFACFALARIVRRLWRGF